MPRHKRLAGVVNSFLGSFVSRYSSHQGYWLMGWFVLEDRDWTFELIPHQLPSQCNTQVSAAAYNCAHETLCDLLVKHDLGPEIVSWAKLEIQLALEGQPIADTRGLQAERSQLRLPEQRRVAVKLKLVSKRGRVYQNCINVFAAAHNPQHELRSGQ